MPEFGAPTRGRRIRATTTPAETPAAATPTVADFARRRDRRVTDLSACAGIAARDTDPVED